MVLKKITASFGGERLSRQRFLGGLALKRLIKCPALKRLILRCASVETRRFKCRVLKRKKQIGNVSFECRALKHKKNPPGSLRMPGDEMNLFGCAQERTRTSMLLPTLDPESSVSTNFTTWAVPKSGGPLVVAFFDVKRFIASCEKKRREGLQAPPKASSPSQIPRLRRVRRAVSSRSKPPLSRGKRHHDSGERLASSR